MVLGARADFFSGAQSTLVCEIEHFGVPSKMTSSRGALTWESGGNNDAESLLVTIQTDSLNQEAQITFTQQLSAEAKASFDLAAKGRPISDEAKSRAQSEIADRSTQILVALGTDGSLLWSGEMYGQQLRISCLPK